LVTTLNYKLIILGIIVLVIISTPIIFALLSFIQFRKRRKLIAAELAFLSFITLVGIFYLIFLFIPGGDAILARVTTPDGVELCLTQKSNYSLEPYTINFYYKRPGGKWGGFYYDHEDTRWIKGTIELNEQGTFVSIKRGSKEVATFDLETDSFTIKRWKRTTKGAQTWKPEDWTPEEHINSHKR